MGQSPTLRPVLVIGMSRSGTTVVTNILRMAKNVHVEMEPHLIWKAGDFDHLGDEDHRRTSGTYDWICDLLSKQSSGRLLVEKSPPNCLRPHTVHNVFPDARVLYTLREPQACLYSNYIRSNIHAALSPRAAIKKYLRDPDARNVRETDFESERLVSVGTPLWNQVRANEVPGFVEYSWRLLRLRRAERLPFGPKLDGFEDLIRDVGLLGYHAQCLMAAAEKALSFRTLYGEAMRVVVLEDLLRDPEVAVREILEFVECDIPAQTLDQIIAGLKTEKQAQPLPSEFLERLASIASPRWYAQLANHIDALQ